MVKAFLSHSNKDKERYVRIVAEKLSKAKIEYDELTFEEGLQPLDEILRGISESDLFVIFLSKNAFSSSWVSKELVTAYEKISSSDYRRLYAIIIDEDVTYEAKEIPQWLRDEYIVKYLPKPTVAARRIHQRLRDISWLKHPRLKELDSIFVGRNSLISSIEECIDSFESEIPVCFIASGLPQVGKFSLLRHGLIKSNIIKQEYDFPSFPLTKEESLEDFIARIHALGFSNSEFPENIMELTIDAKIEIATKFLLEIGETNDILFIRDEGALGTEFGSLVSWFDDILRRTSGAVRPRVIVSLRNRLNPSFCSRRPYLFSIPVPELSVTERKGLLARLLRFEGVDISPDDFNFFSKLLFGLPGQVRFACSLIKDLGPHEAKKESVQLTEFNSEKAKILLSKYESSNTAIEFIYFLSEFEFISLDILDDILYDVEYGPILLDLLSACICDYIGAEREFVRLNDHIRDYIRRNRLRSSDILLDRLKKHVDDFFMKEDIRDSDFSDITYSLKTGLKSGKQIPDEYLYPSIYIKSMQELYQERNNIDKVIQLADKILEKNYQLLPSVEQSIRHYLCLSLARKREQRFLKEVQLVVGPEHDFLLGFYYRLQGRSADAIERLVRCVDQHTTRVRAKRELVQVYINIEEYEMASALAESNYYGSKYNPYNIQAYFNTLINSSDAPSKKETLEKLVSELFAINTDISIQMAKIAQAEIYARCDNNYGRAKDSLNDTIAEYEGNPYPLFSQANIAIKSLDALLLKGCYLKLLDISKNYSLSEDSLSRLESYLYALEGNLKKGISTAESKIKRMPDHAKRKLMQKIQETYQVKYPFPTA